ncbi:MAG TPA: glycosyl hydrolase family 30, partial [Balneolaceae bacterium]|nr:glycosyl hydrolase family 30 [Balneolaceae bacterium]
VYFTPLYYTMSHFSRYIRPGAKRIGFEHSEPELMMTAAQNPDGSIAVVLFNPTMKRTSVKLNLDGQATEFSIDRKSIQTIVIPS